ncbi:glycoside hydrolase family 3 protein [Ramaria rubella]|nr:glycoside hydrolase family 3 protein [Ramaria rubella]
MRGLLIRIALLCVPQLVVSQGFTTRSWSESRSLANRVVANLTLLEKVGVVTGAGAARCIGMTIAVNRSLPGLPTGIPSFCLNDGPAGVRTVDLVTGFPAGINVASTFSRRLMRARGQAIGEEFRGKGINVMLGPDMDIMRSPKQGRAWEGFGPEPWLSGEAAFQTVQGVQSTGVQACAKHFTSYIQEHFRMTYSADVDDRTIHEVYFYPFLRAIEADVSSIMCAYNRFNSTYACGNSGLLGPDGLLGQSGFQGYVVSDWGATHPTTDQYANAGLDMEQPGGSLTGNGGGIFGPELEAAVAAGNVSESRLNDMVARVLTSWFRLGQDSGYPPPNYDTQHPDGGGPLNLNVSVRTSAHTAITREIGGASTVLLKNTNDALPLKDIEKKIAAIGLDILPPGQNCSNNACDEGTVVMGWGSGTISIDFVADPIDAISTYAKTIGAEVTSSPSNDIDAGVQAAIGADVALVFVNAISGEVGNVDGNEGDRNDLELWLNGSSLVSSVAAVNKNTVVVIHSTGPVLVGAWNDSPNVTAVVYAGVPGEQTGPVIIDVLSGAVNPSGRLPFTMAANPDDYPTDILYNSTDPDPTLNFTETLFLDYRHFDQANIKPLYEFGFGLSYTTFSYSELSISLSGSGATVSFTLENTGKRDGIEIPQLYLEFPNNAGEPPKVLRGFDDINLNKGASQRVTFELTERDLSIWDTASQSWRRPSGKFVFHVGASSRDIRLQGSL